MKDIKYMQNNQINGEVFHSIHIDNTVTQKEQVKLSLADGLLAGMLVILGYQYINWMLQLLESQALGIIWVSLIYLGTILVYARHEQIKLTKESYFWIVLFLVISINFGFIHLDLPVMLLQLLFHIWLTLYMTASIIGSLMQEKTSNFFFADLLRIYIIVPLTNFTYVFKGAVKVLKYPFKNWKDSKLRGQALAIVLGAVMSGIALLIIVPQLIVADSSGGFTKSAEKIMRWFSNIYYLDIYLHLETFVLKLLFSLPVTILLGNNILGYLRNKKQVKMTAASTEQLAKSVRVVPSTTVHIVLGVVSICYALFILTQIPYFFSAFLGKLPAGELFYSEYARNGFFELGNVVMFNLLLLLGCNLSSKVSRVDNKILRYLNAILATLTVLLVVTAMSKMGLYIATFGLTVLRVLVCASLVFLFITWTAVLMMQFKELIIMQWIVYSGAIILTIVCTMQIEKFVAWFNLLYGFR